MFGRNKHKPKTPHPEKPHMVDAFDLWYSFARDFKKTQEHLRLADPPIDISLDTLYRWRDNYDWDNRAQERDSLILKARTEKAVQEQLDFLNRKNMYGKLMQKRAVEFFQKKDAQGNPVETVTNAATAMQLLQAGVAMEGQSLGLPDFITEVLTADDDTLRRVYETAAQEFASFTKIDADEGDGQDAFPAVKIEPLPQNS